MFAPNLPYKDAVQHVVAGLLEEQEPRDARWAGRLRPTRTVWFSYRKMKDSYETHVGGEEPAFATGGPGLGTIPDRTVAADCSGEAGMLSTASCSRCRCARRRSSGTCRPS